MVMSEFATLAMFNGATRHYGAANIHLVAWPTRMRRSIK